MATTVRTTSATASRRRGSARARDAETPRDEFDLLTAALFGAAIGAGMTLLFRRGPKGRPIGPIVRAAGVGARAAGVLGARGARWAAKQGEELWDRVPREEIAERVEEYVDSAREAVDSAVAREVRSLRKAIRRQRKRLGV